MKQQYICVVMLALGACGRAEQHATTAPANQVQTTVPAPGTGPNARTPLAPVRPAIDPKSVQAAEELVRGLVRLINSGRFDDAYMLLGAGAPPRTEFDRDLAGFTRVTQGAAGNQEGAAGSIYVSIPLSFSGPGGRKRGATAVLRRVNDVPGSTEAQRRWHIERIDWTPAG
ncbi:MAG: hypothetical protein V4499_01665 [Pseudomonadota bacterium]|jgi:hypothetical protein